MKINKGDLLIIETKGGVYFTCTVINSSQNKITVFYGTDKNNANIPQMTEEIRPYDTGILGYAKKVTDDRLSRSQLPEYLRIDVANTNVLGHVFNYPPDCLYFGGSQVKEILRAYMPKLEAGIDLKKVTTLVNVMYNRAKNQLDTLVEFIPKSASNLDIIKGEAQTIHKYIRYANAKAYVVQNLDPEIASKIYKDHDAFLLINYAV
jgi:hypothetical protein